MMKDDPVIERVRRARRSIVSRCQDEPDKLLRWAKGIESKRPGLVRGSERRGKKDG